MLADIRNRKSLAFYSAMPNSIDLNAVSNGVNSAVAASVVARVGRNVYLYNQEYSSIMKNLNLERSRLATKVTQGLERDASYQGARGDGVSLAWDYEKADIQMGGKGSANWNRSERNEILKRGRVRGAEGHHQKNVADHLNEQANPDNIKFYKNKEEHLQKGHQGKWDNETDAPFIDKDKMLKITNRRRVVKQELSGLGKAAALGLGIGFSLSFIAELAKSDLSAEAVEDALVKGSMCGVKSVVITGTSYGVGLMTSNLLQTAGVDMSSQAGQLLNGSVTGVLSIVLVSTCQLVNLQLEGELNSETAGSIGGSAAYSVSILAVSMIAQSWIGGPIGLIVSSTAGLAMYTASIAKTWREKQLEEHLREYAIEQYR